MENKETSSRFQPENAYEKSMRKVCAIENQMEVLNFMLRMASERTMKNRQIVCEISLAEHCNLGCYGCNYFAPLAKPEFADIEETERDVTRLAELFGHRIRYFDLRCSNNCGAMLQAYALQRRLRAAGVRADIVRVLERRPDRRSTVFPSGTSGSAGATRIGSS